MKIAPGFSLREIAGENIVVPVGAKTVSFQGMITLNGTGAFLWQQLQTDKTETELLAALREEYEVDQTTAAADIKKFLAKLLNANLLA